MAPHFWSYFSKESVQIGGEKTGQLKCCDSLCEAVDYLHGITMQTIPCIERLEALKLQEETYGHSTSSKRILNTVITYYKAIIFFTVPHCFLACVERFYSEAFRVFQHSSSEDPGENDSF